MARTNDSIDIRLISKVSSMYYNQDYNQQEIADRLHLSRPKVSRLLKQAREQGIVQISVISPNKNFVELESALEEKYGLKEALLIESDPQMSGQVIRRQIGSAAADYLHRTVEEGDLIGVTWGTTLQALVDSMQPKVTEGVHVIQTLGGVGPPEAKAHASDISKRLAQLLNGKLTLLPAPGIVGSVQSKEVLLADRQVRAALDLFREINMAFIGIGALATNPVLEKGNAEISAEMIQEIVNSDAVGDIGLRFFDKAGQPIRTDFDDLLIGITLEELKEVDTVVGIAGGPDKLTAIQGALNGKLIDVLITDHITAQKLVA